MRFFHVSRATSLPQKHLHLLVPLKLKHIKLRVKHSVFLFEPFSDVVESSHRSYKTIFHLVLIIDIFEEWL